MTVTDTKAVAVAVAGGVTGAVTVTVPGDLHPCGFHFTGHCRCAHCDPRRRKAFKRRALHCSAFLAGYYQSCPYHGSGFFNRLRHGPGRERARGGGGGVGGRDGNGWVVVGGRRERGRVMLQRRWSVGGLGVGRWLGRAGATVG